MKVAVRSLRVLPIFALLAHAQGCSWIFVQPLPKDYEYGAINCTTSRAAPVVDTLFTATNAISAAYVAGKDNVANKSTAVTLGLSVAALWMLSAIYGYSHTAECEEAIEEGTPYYRPSQHRAPRAYQPPPTYRPEPTVHPQLTGPPASPPPATPAPPAETAPPPAPGAGAGAPANTPAGAPASAPPVAPQQGDDEEPTTRRRPAPSRSPYP